MKTIQITILRTIIPYSIYLSLLILFSFEGCKKDSTVNSDFLYFPTITDVTPNATLQELQDGRDLYISYCNRCHGLYLPESKTPAQWKNVMSSMGPKTGLSAADQLLITKYLCKGRQ